MTLAGRAGRGEPVPLAQLAVMKPTTHHGLGREVPNLLPRCPGRDLHLSPPKSSAPATAPCRGSSGWKVRLEPHSARLCPILWDQQRLTQAETPFRHRSASCRTSGNAQVSHPASDPARRCVAPGCATILLLRSPSPASQVAVPPLHHLLGLCCIKGRTSRAAQAGAGSTEGGRKQRRKRRRKRPQLRLHKAVRLLR